MTAPDAIALEDVAKSYGRTRALDRVEASVPQGTVASLLGPNGAGKTTLVRILTTLERPDSGRAFVCGHDVARHPRAVRPLISVTGQDTTVEPQLTARENLTFHARLWGYPKPAARSRAGALLELIALADEADRPVRGFSSGMRRRIDLACSLLSGPRVLFLDEPTVGLDPVTRRRIWALIADRAAAGTTILLATQQLDEAEHLSDTVCLLDSGRIVRTGTPESFVADLPGDHVEITVADPAQLDRAAPVIGGLADRPPRLFAEKGVAEVTTADGARLVPELIRGLDAVGVDVTEITMRGPTLEAAFLALTSRGTR